MDKLRYVWDHRTAIAASFMALAAAYSALVATPLSRVIKRPDAATIWWKRALFDLFIDTPSWLAVLGRSGILGGIFNLPGVPSRLPFDNPTRAASKMLAMRKVHASSEDTKVDMPTPRGGGGVGGGGTIKFLIVLGLAGMMAATSGCGTAGAQALGRCEMNTIPQALEGLLAQVVAAAFSSGVNWNATLEQAGRDAAPAQVSCLVQAVAGWLERLTTGKRGQLDDTYVEAHRRMRAYLDTHAPSACGDKVPAGLAAAIALDQLLLKLPSAIEPRTGDEREVARFGGGGATGGF